MTIIICEEICQKCAENFIKNPDILGDYNEEGTLLRHCRICGQMKPLLSIDKNYNKGEVSGAIKKLAGTRIASKHQLDHKKMGYLVKSLKETKNKKEFIIGFCIEVRKTFDLDLNKQEVREVL